MKTQSTTTRGAAATTETGTSASETGYLTTCAALLQQLDAAFPETESLTVKDKKHMAKARKGSERYVPHLVALAQQHGVSIAAVPLDGISRTSAEAQQLVPLQQQMQRMMTRVNTRMFSAQASTWSGSSKLYVVLKRLSKDDGELAKGLQPVEQYFNHRHPSVAKDHPKTKKGKAALAAAKAADANAAAKTEAAPAPAPQTVIVPPPSPEAVMVAPQAPPSEATPPAPSANGAAATNGTTHA